MKPEIVFSIAALTVALTVSLYTIMNLRLSSRFANHRIVQDFVHRFCEFMTERISHTTASQKERFLVVTERVTVSDESILSECCSVFFSQEHMRRLGTAREKRLMACAISKQIKKRLIAQCSSCDENKHQGYRVKTKNQRVPNDSQKGFLIHIYYIVPNSSYVQDEKW